MKRLFISLVIISLFGNLSAEISVKSFRLLEKDSTARILAPEKDFNGDISAIIKLVTTQSGFTFDCGSIGIVKTIKKPDGVWIYVPYGAKRISIMHPTLGMLEDWPFPINIEKARVYEMQIFSGKIFTKVQEIEKQYLVISTDPIEAKIFINDSLVGRGNYQEKLKPGKYSYRIEAQLYHYEVGSLELKDAKKNLQIKLQPAFGFCAIKTEPESGAIVTIDGKRQLKSTPCLSEALSSGKHTVEVVKDMYKKTTQIVEITDNQTSELQLSLQPNFADISVTTQNEAKIYVDNEYQVIGNWNGRLNEGSHLLEARREKYRSVQKKVEAKVGEKLTFDIQPVPIVGSLNVNSIPKEATVTINGKVKGTTPLTIQNMLIGDYSIEVSKSGYDQIQKSITINEEQTTQINENFNSSKFIQITSTPSCTDVYLDGKLIGKTPLKISVSFDKHNFEITDGKKTVNQEITINNESSSVLNFELYECNSVKSISSNPSGATVLVNGKNIGVTPLTYTMLNKIDLITIKEKGYTAYNQIIKCDGTDFSTDLTPAKKFRFRDYVSLGGQIGLNSMTLFDLGIGMNIKFVDWFFYKTEYNLVTGSTNMLCFGDFQKKSVIFGEIGYCFNSVGGLKNSAVLGIGYGNFRSNIDLKYIFSGPFELIYRLGF